MPGITTSKFQAHSTRAAAAATKAAISGVTMEDIMKAVNWSVENCSRSFIVIQWSLVPLCWWPRFQSHVLIWKPSLQSRILNGSGYVMAACSL